jgi:hypothetical protein
MVAALSVGRVTTLSIGNAQVAPDIDWSSVLAGADPRLTTDETCPQLVIPNRSVCVFVDTTDSAWLARVFGTPENTHALRATSPVQPRVGFYMNTGNPGPTRRHAGRRPE